MTSTTSQPTIGRVTLIKQRPQLAVTIGRVGPPHRGHATIIDAGTDEADNYLFLAGSSGVSRRPRDPWTFEDRKTMLMNTMTAEQAGRMNVQPLRDLPYNEPMWFSNVQEAVNAECARLGITPSKKTVAMAGHAKDNTSYYLKRFRQFGALRLPGYRDLSSTAVRNRLFVRNEGHKWLHSAEAKESLLPTTIDFLDRYVDGEHYEDMLREFEYVRDYKKLWSNAPYPPTLVTTDAVITHAGHVLMIKRKSFPGRGLWAVPGGYIKEFESLEDAMLRELKEETKLKVAPTFLRANMNSYREFADPYRSARGRVITHAFLINLPAEIDQPEVRAASDAKRAEWVPLANVREDMCFEDHYHIIHTMLAQKDR